MISKGYQHEMDCVLKLHYSISRTCNILKLNLGTKWSHFSYPGHSQLGMKVYILHKLNKVSNLNKLYYLPAWTIYITKYTQTNKYTYSIN